MFTGCVDPSGSCVYVMWLEEESMVDSRALTSQTETSLFRVTYVLSAVWESEKNRNIKSEIYTRRLIENCYYRSSTKFQEGNVLSRAC